MPGTTVPVAAADDREHLLVFDPSADPRGVEAYARRLRDAGATACLLRLGDQAVIAARGRPSPPTVDPALPRPVAVVPSAGDVRLGRRGLRPHGTLVTIGDAVLGDGGVAVFAGPCAVESPEQMRATATAVRLAGAVGLRGGAFKPRTSPWSFQGLRWSGLELLAEARAATGLPILTEVVDPRHVERVAQVADGLQIGARNMQNFELLTAVGRAGRPVVLKRGFGCTVDEVLAAAEYLLREGNDQVVLCERGIRTFEPATRFTLDVSAVALLKQRSHLPVMVDPSHSCGIPSLVAPVALAAVAAGADALLVDVHVRPSEALCDGRQALRPDEFGALMGRVASLAVGLGREVAGQGVGPLTAVAAAAG